LQEILDDEKAADEKLTALAEAGINQESADAADSGDEESDTADEGTERRQKPRTSARTK